MPKKKQSTPNVAVIYARYSSHAQKDASIEQQIAECTEYAQVANLQVIEVYADRAVSGKTDQRASFQRMMRDAEKGKFGTVIAWKSNRIGRNMLQAMLNEERLSELGVKVLYVEEDFDDTAAGRFALRSMMNVNQFYSENMAEDIRRGLRDNALNGKITNGLLPYGYRKGPDGKYEVDEAKAAVVREIFTRVACGDTYANIAADLNARGVKTGRGKEWGRSSFHTIVNNERYTGVYIYDDIRVEDGVPQIVDKDLFLRVQAMSKIKKNVKGRHNSNGDFLLTGKLYCGKCKGHMVGNSGTSKQGIPHYYYVCNNQRVKRICDKTAVRRDWIEEEVAKIVKQHIIQDDVVNWIANISVQFSKESKKNSELAMLEDELAENKRATRNILNAIEMGVVTVTTKSRLIELETEQSNLLSKIAVAKSDIVDIKRDDVIAWLDTFRNGDITDKMYQAKLINDFVSAVYVYDDNIKIVFTFGGKNNDIKNVIEKIDHSCDEECELDGVRISSRLLHHAAADGLRVCGGIFSVWEIRDSTSSHRVRRKDKNRLHV